MLPPHPAENGSVTARKWGSTLGWLKSAPTGRPAGLAISRKNVTIRGFPLAVFSNFYP